MFGDGETSYNTFLVILYVICIVLGLLRFLCPSLMLKKEKKDDDKAISREKRSGLVMIIAGFLCVIMQFAVMQ